MKFPPFDVGFELEFFLTQAHEVRNASKVMAAQLGFSIDQNNSQGKLQLDRDTILRTDGTPCELQWFQPHNAGRLPPNPRHRITTLEVLKPYTKTFFPYIRAGSTDLVFGKRTVFTDPGTVFSSRKSLINAYSGAIRMPPEKKKSENVSMRTGGLHLHFSVATRNGREVQEDLINNLFGSTGLCTSHALVKLLDRIYDTVFVNDPTHPLSAASARRVREFQTLGEYRIKDHGGDLRTLEYRQLDCSMDWERVQRLIDTFQFAAKEILEA